MYGVDPSREGSQDYYDSIVELYAEWGVDFIKADDMSNPYHAGEIELLNNAIDTCGRDIVLSLSPGPTPIDNAEHVKTHANMWRLSGDVWDKWRDVCTGFELAERWNAHREQGHWPDLDMLPFGRLELLAAEDGVGHGRERWTRLTRNEQFTMITLWIIFRSPLMIGANLPDNDAWTLSLLTNDETLAIAKNSHSNRQLYRGEDRAAWAASGTDGSHYLALFNLGPKGVPIEATFEQIGLKGRYSLRDLWLRRDLGEADSVVAAKVPSHGAKLFRLTPVDRKGG